MAFVNTRSWNVNLRAYKPTSAGSIIGTISHHHSCLWFKGIYRKEIVCNQRHRFRALLLLLRRHARQVSYISSTPPRFIIEVEAKYPKRSLNELRFNFEKSLNTHRRYREQKVWPELWKHYRSKWVRSKDSPRETKGRWTIDTYLRWVHDQEDNSKFIERLEEVNPGPESEKR